jgi:hypothetical protein
MAGEIVSLKDQLGGLAPSDAGRVYLRAVEILALAEDVTKAVEDLARVQPIPLPDGSVLKEVPVSWKTKVHAEIAETVLAETFGPDVAAQAIEQEKRTTLTAIKEALRPISPRGTLGKNEERAVNAIRAKGGLREGTSPGVRRVKP